MNKRPSILDKLKSPATDKEAVNSQTNIHRFFEGDIELFTFSDKAHLKNHLNYLIHSDSKDKYTNEDSVGNKTIVFVGGSMKVTDWLSSYEERKKFTKEIYRSLEKDFDFLYLGRVECRNPQIFHWNSDMEKEMLAMIADMRQEGFEPLIVQIHDDQPNTWCHFHVVARQAAANIEEDD